MNSNYKKVIIAIIFVLIALNAAVWPQVFEINSRQLKVVFFDVGQGDAIFIETPQKTQILIDGGPGTAILEKLNQEMAFFDREIDLIISTHPDSDHLAGLVETMKSYQIDSVGWSGVRNSEPLFKEFLKEINIDKAGMVVLSQGKIIRVGKNLFFEILSPGEEAIGKEVKDANASSLVLRMVYGESEFLFTADASQSVEKKLAQNADISSDVLKVSHHGSKTATSEDFLKAVSPAIAVIQVGKNSYGHPSVEVLDRLEKYGIKVIRTDERGNIRFFSDGEKIIINTKK